MVYFKTTCLKMQDNNYCRHKTSLRFLKNVSKHHSHTPTTSAMRTRQHQHTWCQTLFCSAHIVCTCRRRKPEHPEKTTNSYICKQVSHPERSQSEPRFEPRDSIFIAVLTVGLYSHCDTRLKERRIASCMTNTKE